MRFRRAAALREEEERRQPAGEGPRRDRHRREPGDEDQLHRRRDVRAAPRGADRVDGRSRHGAVAGDRVAIGLQPQRDHPVGEVGEREDPVGTGQPAARSASSQQRGRGGERRSRSSRAGGRGRARRPAARSCWRRAPGRSRRPPPARRPGRAAPSGGPGTSRRRSGTAPRGSAGSRRSASARKALALVAIQTRSIGVGQLGLPQVAARHRQVRGGLDRPGRLARRRRSRPSGTAP